MLGKKNRWKKVRKHVFYIHTNIVTKKWGEKNARNNFSSNKPIERAKNAVKKIFGKKCEKTSLYSQEYRDQKIGGKKARNNFSRYSTNSASKKCEEKNRQKKVRKNVFYNHTIIVT